MKTERRESLETINVPAEPVGPGRRPPSGREASDTCTVWKHRGRGEGMSAKDQGVNTGNPIRWAASAQPAGREAQAGPDRVADRPEVASKRVTIVERRGLSSRVRFEGARARGLATSLATSLKRSAVPESLRCLSEPWRACWVLWVGDRINHLVRKPDAGDPHVRFDERDLETEPSGHRARSRLYAGTAGRRRLCRKRLALDAGLKPGRTPPRA
jgi:hypothetical protein